MLQIFPANDDSGWDFHDHHHGGGRHGQFAHPRGTSATFQDKDGGGCLYCKVNIVKNLIDLHD